MAAQKQIDANRANGAESKGPGTPEGKRIALNNLGLPEILSGTIGLAAITFRNLAGNRALTTLLKLRQMADPSLDSDVYPPIQFSTETWG